jgi:hypothetical protein
MWHAWEKGDIHAGFWCGDLTATSQLENPRVDVRVILQHFLKCRLGLRIGNCQALVNAEMNLLVPYSVGSFLASTRKR